MASPLQKLRHFAHHSSLLWKNPGVIPMVIAGYANALVLRKPVLRTLEFAITANCNVNCSMCYATKLVDKQRTQLTPAEYGDLYAQARDLGCFTVHLSGGEPTLRKDLPQILANLMPGRTLISMTTNSTLLEPAYLERLRRGGLSVLHYSLNSVDPEVNDAQRDFKGHHSRIMQQLALAKSLDYEVCLSIVVAHDKLDEMRRLTEFAAQHEVGVVFSLATPAGNWAGAMEQVLTPDEWATVDAYMASNPHVRSDWTINLSMKKGCPAGYEKLSVSPYGDVQGCAMSFISHGDLREERLESIWRRTMEFEPYKKRSDKCLIGLDRGYIEEYLLPVNGADILPVPIERHPVHPYATRGERK